MIEKETKIYECIWGPYIVKDLYFEGLVHKSRQLNMEMSLPLKDSRVMQMVKTKKRVS